MKYLMTLAALFVSSLAMAQMPYNPDANGDNMVGSGDLLTFLTFYGNELIQSDLTCDYEGTELEQLFIGLSDATLQLDSIYVEYLIYDTLSYYLPGCPDLVNEPVVLERSYTLPSANYIVNENGIYCEIFEVILGYQRGFSLRYSPETNLWRLRLRDREIEIVTTFGPDCYWLDAPNADEYVGLPFPETWVLNQDGIQVGWRSTSWVANCENFRLIPFWSVAE